MLQERHLAEGTNPVIWPHLGLRPVALLLFALLLAGAFSLNLVLGSVTVPLDQVLLILTGQTPEHAPWTTIVRDFRLPKALTATLAGSALGVAGLQMQTLFRNPLADPFVLGVSAGASLGVALVVLSVGVVGGASMFAVSGWLNQMSLTVAASVGAALVLGVVLLLARHVQQSVTLLIVGLMIGYLTSALVSLLVAFAVAPERVQAYIVWNFGSFGGVTWQQLQVFAPTILIGMVIAFALTKSLNALLLGESYARSMGLRVTHSRFWIVTSASLLAGAVTAFCGPIAFLGIAVPHFCRTLLATADHRVLLPSVTLLGATCALLVDLVAQLPGHTLVLPLNAVMSLVGAPVVIWVLLHRPAGQASMDR
ncbi:MAG: iron ABC transporter permease [Chloroflexaceae bacterium]|nr:iron ABC transporter permease [Chloroflexaceae bacterium]